jgi:serine/threonine-protein kinase RsbW
LKALDIYNNSIPSNLDKISGIVSDVINNLQNDGHLLDECTLFELKVILNEVLINAIKHGNKEDESKYVKVNAGIVKDDLLYIVVEDEGMGYGYDCFCINHKAVNEESDICNVMESGRGILIINSLCDNIKVNTRGNKIVLLKTLKRI